MERVLWRYPGDMLERRQPDKRDLFTRVERVRRVEACPKCHAAMVFDRSSRGWWFRCMTNACDGRRDLGKDPARAVELPTQVP